tara:strand:+ start:305 stop:505 length:201 start_codon:yes stop_codon:yes gene_type:complete
MGNLANLKRKFELINFNYWEHHKWAHELVQALGPTHPKYLRAQEIVNNLLDEKNKLSKQISVIEKD